MQVRTLVVGGMGMLASSASGYAAVVAMCSTLGSSPHTPVLTAVQDDATSTVIGCVCPPRNAQYGALQFCDALVVSDTTRWCVAEYAHGAVTFPAQ